MEPKFVTGYINRVITKNSKFGMVNQIRDESGTIITEQSYTLLCKNWTPLNTNDMIIANIIPVGHGVISLNQDALNFMTLDESPKATVTAIAELAEVTQNRALKLYIELEDYLKTHQEQTKAAYKLATTDKEWSKKLPSAEECSEWHFTVWKVNDLISYHALAFKENPIHETLVQRIVRQHLDNRAKNLLTKWVYDRLVRQLYLLGIRKNQINDIEDSPLEILHRLRTNPYFYPQIKIEIADHLNIMYRLSLNTQVRECGIVVRQMYNQLINTKWTYVPIWLMNKWFGPGSEIKYSKTYNYNFSDIIISSLIPLLSNYFNVKVEQMMIEAKQEIVFMLPRPYEVETFLANIFKKLIKFPLDTFEAKYSSDKLSEKQKEAVNMALNSAISAIDGKAGSGKTTTMREILYNLRLKGEIFMATAFTGKAVVRIREVLKSKDPRTLHSMIHTGGRFNHLVVDEASMVSSGLMKRFFKKYPPIREDGGLNYRITLVGDNNQLEPIEWGWFFKELIRAKVIPQVSLNTVFRTEANSIISNANSLLDSESVVVDDVIGENDLMVMDPDVYEPEDGSESMLKYPFNQDVNFKVISGDRSVILGLVQFFYKLGKTWDQVTCITPFSKAKAYVSDIDEINIMFNSVYLPSPGGYLMDKKGVKWLLGERVMNTVNISTAGLFNGDEGRITRCSDSGIEVTFSDDRIFFYHNRYEVRSGFIHVSKEEMTLDILIKSSCMTCHKAQGSEYDVVFIYIPPYKGKFITKNWLYTAITRAVRHCLIVGDMATLDNITHILPKARRETLLYRLLA